ncbi:RNA polymerase sigma factor [Actinoplanes sp. HUAS TT8]|uniref:RNA polymerase sigma factor n=1 Tax=Actinoplanes sp. HUAS TT8 TaxID=3447453 RepID=UPI003F521F00
MNARLTWLRRLALAVCGDWHRADDLVQDVLVRLYKVWPLRDEGAIDAWLRTTLIRRWTDETRSAWRRRERPTDAVPEFADSHAGPDDDPNILNALAKLSPRRRACLVLRFLEDLPVTETASIMNVSEGTVKSLTSRALEDLRQLMGAEHVVRDGRS